MRPNTGSKAEIDEFLKETAEIAAKLIGQYAFINNIHSSKLQKIGDLTLKICNDEVKRLSRAG